MDPETHMLQHGNKGGRFLQVESKLESTTDVPVNDGVYIDEEKMVKVDIGMGEGICATDQMEGLNSVNQVDVGVEKVDKKDYEVMNFEDKAYVVSLYDKTIAETRGYKVGDINVQNIENKDGHSRVDGKKGDLLEERGDKHLDTTYTIGECHILSAPSKEDGEKNALFSVSNFSFISDTLLQKENDVEPIIQLSVNEGLSIEDEKWFKAKIMLGETMCTIDQMEGLKSTKQVDVDATRVDKKDDKVVCSEDKTHVVSQNNIVAEETRGEKGSNLNFSKLDNKEGKSNVDGANGASLEEKGDKYDTNDLLDENYLPFAPTKEDWESELFNISNNSFLFDPLLQLESEVEPTSDVPMIEGVNITEEKPFMVESGFGETVCVYDQIDAPSTKQVDVKMERVEEKDDLGINFEYNAHVVSLNDKVTGDTKGHKCDDINVKISDNNDAVSKVDGENGSSLLDTIGGNYPLFSPIKEYRKEISFLNISNNSFMFDYTQSSDESGTEVEQEAFLKELEIFHKNNLMEFKPSKFYGEGLNYLKLWRQVSRLGGYDQVTSHKMWRQVGESFNPPRTCTTISWSFRNFYEKVLLEYERHKTNNGKFKATTSILVEKNPHEKTVDGSNVCRRVRRESTTRAMQSWHYQRPPRNGSLKRKRIPANEDAKEIQHIPDKQQDKSTVIDVGSPADWVKINVLRNFCNSSRSYSILKISKKIGSSKDSYEVYALIPGFEREELRVQSDPAGRLIITGQPAEVDNPWGITRFKKVIVLPSRIDPSQTSAFLNLHGRLYVSVALEKPKSE